MVRSSLVAVSLTVTVASGTTALLWSVTIPVIVPIDVVCAHPAKRDESTVPKPKRWKWETRDNMCRTRFITTPFVKFCKALNLFRPELVGAFSRAIRLPLDFELLRL